MVHESLRLYISSDSFTLEPAYFDPGVLTETLVINRESGLLQRNAPPLATLRQEEVLIIYGLLGIIRLNAGDHLIVLSDRVKVGAIQGNDIFKITSTKVIPVPKSRLHLSDRQLQDDDKYLSLLEDMLSRQFFYTSYTYDLTNSLQRQSQIFGGKKFWENADDRFFWNRHLQTKLIDFTTHNPDQDLSNFILPIICGFVDIKQVSVNNHNFSFSLITRRSRFRAGTRFNMRGIDDLGNVANFVETEQIVHMIQTNQKVSYLQTRGSMPLYWRQIPNIKYTPKLVIDGNPNAASSFRKHFTDQINLYGDQIVVNLINKKGYEGGLGEEFSKQIGQLNDSRVRYIHFDFHQHCKNMRWDHISLLTDDISGDLTKQGYCQIDGSGKLLRTQNSVVRTNCMDCLDRTNVVQSVLARIFLTRQLRDLGVLSPQENVEESGRLEEFFKHMWADNADAISTQYSGTGALKTDFTRTGKRTKMGLLQDGYNSAVRYVKNNFMDGARQDTFDLFVGRYQVIPGAKSPFLAVDNSMSLLLFAFCHSAIVLSLMTMVYMLFWQIDLILFRIFYNLILLFVAFVSLQILLANGTKFVDKPALISSNVHITLPPLYEDDNKKEVSSFRLSKSE